jgi:DNA-binding SARP family transcriptional activator
MAATAGATAMAGTAGADAPAVPATAALAAVQLRTLGGFRVLRDGELLGAAAWQSKKARTLLKILAARRGRPAPRDELMELLWPGEPRDKLGNRLSVALTTLRGVLDPGKAHPADHFIRAGEGAVALELATVALDAEAFLADVDAGLAAENAGRADEAAAALAHAERRYAGDFLEEDRYEDWALPLREELRAARGAALRASARLAAARGDADAAVRAHLRVLERDPFDAPVHLDLVRLLQTVGRHGEALHRYREYVRAMREVGVAPAPLPA